MNTTNTNTAPASGGNSAEARQIILKEISSKWGKFSDQDLSALKSKDDLVTQVSSKYSLDKAQAQRDVDALMKGRSL